MVTISITRQLELLPHYSSILEGKGSAGFRVLRAIPIDLKDVTEIPWGRDPWKDAGSGEGEDPLSREFRRTTDHLWELHEMCMEQYNEMMTGNKMEDRREGRERGDGKEGEETGYRKEAEESRNGKQPNPQKKGNETRPHLLDLKIELARRMLLECNLCERKCGVDRSKGIPGACGVLVPRISSEFLHMGEEPCLVPSHTIFFAGCNLTCIFCQNWDISQQAHQGARFTQQDIARLMDKRTALNTNWVGGDPTPNLHFILGTLAHVQVNRPQIWNSNMYLTTRTMELLNGAMDLYLTDFKYGNDECGHELSGVDHYFDVMKRNHEHMKGQDTIIRHLVLPGHLDCCTEPILTWIAENRPDAVVNVMAQYHPDFKTMHYPGLDRRLKDREFSEALEQARELGLTLIR